MRLEDGIKLVEQYEKGRGQLLKNIKTAKYNDPKLHLEYFFVPCLLTTVAKALPFTRASSILLAELIERANELQSVLEDIESNKIEIDDARKSKLLADFKKEIQSRMNKIVQWKKKSQLSHDYVVTLLQMYGEHRAPYYYDRKLRRILGQE